MTDAFVEAVTCATAARVDERPAQRSEKEPDPGARCPHRGRLALRAPLRSFAAGPRARCVWQRDMALPELCEPHRQRRRALSRVSPAELEGRGGRESRGVDALTSAGPKPRPRTHRASPGAPR